MYYGMPVSDVNVLKTLNCDVLNFWGTQDGFINGEVIGAFEKNMKAAGKNLTSYSYNAGHGFANPSNAQAYNADAAADSYQKTLAFLKERLR